MVGVHVFDDERFGGVAGGHGGELNVVDVVWRCRLFSGVSGRSWYICRGDQQSTSVAKVRPQPPSPYKVAALGLTSMVAEVV